MNIIKKLSLIVILLSSIAIRAGNQQSDQKSISSLEELDHLSAGDLNSQARGHGALIATSMFITLLTARILAPYALRSGLSVGDQEFFKCMIENPLKMSLGIGIINAIVNVIDYKIKGASYESEGIKGALDIITPPAFLFGLYFDPKITIPSLFTLITSATLYEKWNAKKSTVTITK